MLMYYSSNSHKIDDTNILRDVSGTKRIEIDTCSITFYDSHNKVIRVTPLPNIFRELITITL